MVAKALNPMDAYRREQKKKELKKNRTERQKSKQIKLSTLNPDEIQDQIKKLERQILTNPTDGPTRKRKRELEDTLKSVVKKRKEIEEEQRKQAEAAPSAPKTLKDLEAENRERFQSPEKSIYYHPTLNPFGAPPPGKPQMYRVSPPMPMVRPPPPPRQHNRQHSQRGPPRFPPRGPRGPPRYDGRNGIPPPPPPPRPAASAPVAPKRPGKRPPLPPGPIPSGIIQVPTRPPLPAGPSPFHPPPPASGGSKYAPPPPHDDRPIEVPPASAVDDSEQLESYDNEEYADPSLDTEESDVVAPYPPPEDVSASTEPEQTLDDEEIEEQRAQLRSLVPVALRFQRKSAARPAAATARTVVSAPGPRPPPLAMRPPPPPPRTTAPGPPIAPASVDKPSGGDRSVSKEFDAFMDEVKDLL